MKRCKSNEHSTVAEHLTDAELPSTSSAYIEMAEKNQAEEGPAEEEDAVCCEFNVSYADDISETIMEKNGYSVRVVAGYMRNASMR